MEGRQLTLWYYYFRASRCPGVEDLSVSQLSREGDSRKYLSWKWLILRLVKISSWNQVSVWFYASLQTYLGNGTKSWTLQINTTSFHIYMWFFTTNKAWLNVLVQTIFKLYLTRLKLSPGLLISRLNFVEIIRSFLTSFDVAEQALPLARIVSGCLCIDCVRREQRLHSASPKCIPSSCLS